MDLRHVARLGVLVAASFAGGVLFNQAHATTSEEEPTFLTAQLGRVLVRIENAYVEPVDRRRLLEGAIAGMVAELDPHSSYLPPEEWRLFQSETEGRFGGVGIEVDARGGELTVLAPIEGAPAWRTGVHSGDVIVAIDGETVQLTASGGGLDKIIKRMRGAPGSLVKLTLKREGEKEPVNVELRREVVDVPSVTSKLLDRKVAYVRVRQFQERTHDEFLRAVARLRTEARGELTGVLLDLRTNPGGLVDEAASVADEFLDGGLIFTMRHRGRVIEEVKAHGGGAFAGIPAVVLVNEYSASAAELVAGALQDQKRARIVGANTFGKGSVQSILELPGNTGLRLTTARYYTPSGHAIQADGVHPEVVVSSPRDGAGVRVLRERDLEGHLPAELSAGSTRSVTVVDAGGEERTDGGDAGMRRRVSGAIASEIPNDPRQGQDPALKVGYELVLGTFRP